VRFAWRGEERTYHAKPEKWFLDFISTCGQEEQGVIPGARD
jgi:hypothetical protein